MSSSLIQQLRGLADSGQNAQLQKQIGQLVRSGAIDKRQATNLFGELVPIATKNQKPPEPLSNSELADLRTRFANLEGGISAALVSRAIQNGQISNDEAMEYNRRINEIRGRGASKAPSTTNKSVTSSQSGSSAPSSQSGSSAPSSQSGSSAPSSQSGSSAPFGSAQTRESFNELIAKLKKSKAESASRLGGTNTPAPKVTAPAPSPGAAPSPGVTAPAPSPAPAPAPRVTGPAFKVVNTPVSNPDAPTNNVTKPTPTGAATGPAPKNKKQARLNSDFDAIENLDLSQEEKNDLKFSRAQADNNTFNRGDFKFLLNKLEGSKIRQNRDAQSQERQNIYSRGLSSMFANF
jgi:hypothetical protein